MKVLRTCKVCKKEFFVFPAWVRKGAAKYCSRKCSDSDRPSLPEEQRFCSKVRVDINGCWNWIGAKMGGGYGGFMSKRHNPKVHMQAHRWAYEYFKGPIPEGLTIDHLCRNRACVNLEHLEAVTMKENLRRGNGFAGINARRTCCKNGHLLVPYPYTGSAQRHCPICTWEREKRRRSVNREHYLEVKRNWESLHRNPVRKKREENHVDGE
jgi:hypothetical protein